MVVVTASHTSSLYNLSSSVMMRRSERRGAIVFYSIVDKRCLPTRFKKLNFKFNADSHNRKNLNFHNRKLKLSIVSLMNTVYDTLKYGAPVKGEQG